MMPGEGRVNGALPGWENSSATPGARPFLQALAAQREILAGLGVAADRSSVAEGTGRVGGGLGALLQAELAEHC
jgi:hypothetical protein